MNNTPPKDAELLERYRKGDHQAWNALVERYKHLVYNIPYHLAFTSAEANHIFRSVWQHLPQALPLRNPHQLKEWLVLTTIRECQQRRGDARYQTLSHYTHLSDAELLAVYQAGDERAWDVLVERYKRLIYSIPLNFKFTSYEADDVFQSVWLSLHQHLPLREPDRVKAWLVTTAKRKCWDHRRGAKYKREESVAPDELPQERWHEALTPDEIVMRYERHENIRQAMARLKPKCRQLLQHLFYEQLSYDDVAEKMNMSVGSLGPTRGRCLKKLKELITS